MKKPEMTAETFRLPKVSTQEHLETHWRYVARFGDRVLLAGYYFDWFGAIYQFTTNDHSCEGPICLIKVSEDFFEDEGHALRWAMEN